jgi:hypothetical protein
LASLGKLARPPIGQACYRSTAAQVSDLSGHRVVYAEKLEPPLMQPIITVAAQYGIIPKTFPAGDMVADLG